MNGTSALFASSTSLTTSAHKTYKLPLEPATLKSQSNIAYLAYQHMPPPPLHLQKIFRQYYRNYHPAKLILESEQL
uniref:Uncharacterized protein n=1 Tax=Noccaea caerulescens TaxID=107243 RepID=A0A1J3HUQ2_NOCCA